MFVSTIRKKNKCYEHTAFSYKHIPICYNESKRLRDSILSPFFHSYIFAMYKNEALWI